MPENTPPQDGSHQSPEPNWWQQQAGSPAQPGVGQQAGQHSDQHQAQQYPPHPQPFAAATTQPIVTGPGARRRRAMSMPILATALIAGLVGGGIGVGGTALLAEDTATPMLTQQAPIASNVSAKPGSVSYAAQVALKSTVDIQAATSQGTATGTGIILSRDGYVMTNNHVVSGAGNRLQVTTPDGAKHAAKVVGTAPSYDLAVIKLQNVDNLTPATLGESSTLQVGQPVAAVGSPEQLSNTVTSGIVSALSRTVTAGSEDGGQTVVYNGLQTDAPINPGNSGGPLVNMDGQVVGVNSAVETGQSSNNGVQAFGLGFAIPIDTAKRIANELMADGEATKPVLGVTGAVGSSSEDGAQLRSVEAGGAAAKAGIKQGDVITRLDQTTVNNYADLMAQVLKHQPGQTIPVTVRHADGSTQTVEVTLGSTTDTEQTTVGGQSQPNQPGQQGQNPYGGNGFPNVPGLPGGN